MVFVVAGVVGLSDTGLPNAVEPRGTPLRGSCDVDCCKSDDYTHIICNARHINECN